MGEVFCVWGGKDFLQSAAVALFLWVGTFEGDLRKHQNGHIVGNDPCVVPFLFQMIIHAKQVNSYKILSDRFLPANRVRSRTLQQIPTSQSDKKTSPKSTRKKQSEPNLRNAKAGALGGSSREVREVWRVGTPLRKRGSCASKVFPCSHQQFFAEKT